MGGEGDNEGGLVGLVEGGLVGREGDNEGGLVGREGNNDGGLVIKQGPTFLICSVELNLSHNLLVLHIFCLHTHTGVLSSQLSSGGGVIGGSKEGGLGGVKEGLGGLEGTRGFESGIGGFELFILQNPLYSIG